MFGPKELIVIGILFLLLFGGRGKISAIMGDLAKGITSFKKGLKEDPDAQADQDKSADEAIDVTPPKTKTAEKVNR